MVSAGLMHTVLLRSDGNAVAFGWNEDGRCDVPPLVPGLGYVGCAAGARHTVRKHSAYYQLITRERHTLGGAAADSLAYARKIACY